MSDLRWDLLAAVRAALGTKPLTLAELGQRTGLGLPSASPQHTPLGGALRWLEDAGYAARDGEGWIALRGARQVALPLALVDGPRAALTERLAVGRAPRGWSKAQVDWRAALATIPTLRLRPDRSLIAYVWRDGGHGAGVVWAVPSKLGHPDPGGLPRVDKGALAVPKPAGAEDDPISAFELDGTPASYAHAWLLRQELGAFGAVGAESDWPFHRVVDRLPWEAGITGYVEPSPAAAWTWPAGPPAGPLGPVLQLGPAGRATLVVHTWAFLEQERLVQHTVRQQAGGTLLGEAQVTLGTSTGAIVL
jgi:hypothetical protein